MCNSVSALDGVNLKVWHLDEKLLSDIERRRALDGVIMSETMLFRGLVYQLFWMAKHKSNL
jgi:hypothetical protein